MQKECTKCGVSKPFDKEHFKRESNNKSGLAGTCKECHRKHLKEYYKNRKRTNIDSKECSKCGIEKPMTEEFYHRHKRSSTGFKTACKKCRKIESRRYNTREETKAFYRNKRKTDPAWKLRKNVSTAIVNSLKTAKEGSCFDYLPYTLGELKEHLEKQFEPWMCWDNWGTVKEHKNNRTWNIDHIYPQSLLPYESMKDENFTKCWSLDNLRPLDAVENVVKSNHLTKEIK